MYNDLGTVPAYTLTYDVYKQCNLKAFYTLLTVMVDI